MKINSPRNSLLRSRTLRSARRSRTGRLLGSRTTSGSASKTGSAGRASSSAAPASASQAKQAALYEKIEKSADDVQKAVKDMAALGKKTYADDEAGQKAREQDRKDLIADIKDFVSGFNTVHGALEDAAGSTNLAFRKSLDSIVTSNSSALKDIGITVSKDGELSIDEKALESADPEKVNMLFAKADGFADKIGGRMESIGKSASTTLTAMNRLYGATSTYNRYGTSGSNYSSGGYYNGGSWFA